MIRYSIPMRTQDDPDEWRDWARKLIAHKVPADAVEWRAEDALGSLFADGAPPPLPSDAAPITVPRPFLDLAHTVLLHRDPQRWSILYYVLARLQAEPGFIHDKADTTMAALMDMARAVRRDIHKMRAFVRFREVDDRYVAWFEPDHHIVRHNAQFFINRFTAMHWSILTPDITIHWDGVCLSEGPGADRSAAPTEDPVEDLWKSYYASTFNPARVKVKAMLKEMPRKYWKNMPETALVGDLLGGAQKREQAMLDAKPKRGADPARECGVETANGAAGED